MKVAKIVVVTVLVVYVVLVIVVESLLGYFQPETPQALIITTTDQDGTASDRVLAGFDMDDKLYVAANHWPRGWYNSALANPTVEIERNGERSTYTAVSVEGEERDRIAESYQLGFVIRFLTGFPPRRFLRLDPG